MKGRGRLRTGRGSQAMAITRSRAPWRSPWSIATSAIVVAAVVLVLTSPTKDPADPRADDGDDAPGRIYHDVGIPLADVGAQASWYTYESGDVQVRFFTVADGGGALHVGMDACDVCYSAHLGFHQNGTRVQCNSCGKSFKVEGIGTENLPNSCWPGFVPHETSDGFVIIDTQFLDSKAYMFE